MQSMDCVDGVCCNSPCNGPDERCDTPGRDGECVIYRTAPAPALSWPAWALAIAALIAVAEVAMRRHAAR